MYALSINFAGQRYCHNLFKMMKRGKRKKKKRNYKQEYSTQQGYHSHLKERKKFTDKQIFELSTNKPVCKSSKGTSLSRKKNLKI